MKPKLREQYKIVRAHPASESIADLPFCLTETILDRIQYLRYHKRMSLSAIAALDEFGSNQIPPGTIQWMYENGQVAKRWKSVLRWKTSKPRNRANVNLDNLQSCADTLIDHLTPEQIDELICKLIGKLHNSA